MKLTMPKTEPRKEPPPLTLWQRLFNWLDSRVSRWVGGGR